MLLLPRDWCTIVTACLTATFAGLVAILGVAALAMAATLGGFIVIVLMVMDVSRLATVIAHGLVLIGPLTFLLLPALTLP